MMISLSTPLYDLQGMLTLSALDREWLGETSRRVSRSATLDGGVAVEDRGYADGDRNIDLDCPNAIRAEYERAAYLQRTYPRLSLSTPGGVFTVAIERLTVSDGSTLTLTLMIIERIV